MLSFLGCTDVLCDRLRALFGIWFCCRVALLSFCTSCLCLKALIISCCKERLRLLWYDRTEMIWFPVLLILVSYIYKYILIEWLVLTYHIKVFLDSLVTDWDTDLPFFFLILLNMVTFLLLLFWMSRHDVPWLIFFIMWQRYEFSKEICDFAHVNTVIYHNIPPHVLDLTGQSLFLCSRVTVITLR